MKDWFFEKMYSNTLAGSANQTYFCPPDEHKAYTGRVFYKVFAGGEFSYAFLFSGQTDSSFPIENVSPCNTEVTGWTIVNARVGVCAECSETKMPTEIAFQQIYFDEKTQKRVSTPSLFWSDEVKLSAKDGEYLCLEITYKGKRVPHHYENTIPTFLHTEGGWQPNHCVVFANMVGCNRKVKKRIVFFGDSITQGIGVPNNSYLHWNALLAERLGKEYAFWNLGIGYGRANDGATKGVWFEKAKHSDIVFVCFGVNDIFRIKQAEQTKEDLFTVVKKLKEAGCKVVIQTIPPFDYGEEYLSIWQNLNDYVKMDLQRYVDLVLDTQPFLEKENVSGGAKYNGHPNAEGCKIWADGIFSAVKNFIERS